MIKILNIKIQLKLVFFKKKFKNYNFIIVPLPKKKSQILRLFHPVKHHVIL
jgi:hypothetical protein